MRLVHLSTCVPDVTDSRGTWSGWLLHDGEHLVDATMNVVRLWSISKTCVVSKVLPFLEQLHSVRGRMALLRRQRIVLTAHTDPDNSSSELYARDAATLRPRRHLLHLEGAVQALELEADGEGFAIATAVGDDSHEGKVMGLSAAFDTLFELDHAPSGQVLWIKRRGILLETLCNYHEPGVEVYNTEAGFLDSRLAQEAPVTHLLYSRGDDLWLFQEEGQLQIWDLDSQTLKRSVDLGHRESHRSDFKHGSVVSFDASQSHAVTLGTDQTVRLWRLRDWSLLSETTLPGDGTWIEFDDDAGVVAVGTLRDRIELFTISP